MASWDDSYVKLQQTIYTRWVNQKLSARLFPTMTDVLKDLGQDDHLSNLVTALSEKEMPKPAKKEKRVVKAQKLDWISRQLDFVFSCGVEMKLKPSPGNIYEGDSKDIMGLVYAIMLKFLKFDDDEAKKEYKAEQKEHEAEHEKLAKETAESKAEYHEAKKAYEAAEVAAGISEPAAAPAAVAAHPPSPAVAPPPTPAKAAEEPKEEAKAEEDESMHSKMEDGGKAMDEHVEESGKAMDGHMDESAKVLEEHSEEAAKAREEHAEAAAEVAKAPVEAAENPEQAAEEAGAGPNAKDPEAQAASEKALDDAKKSAEAQEEKDGLVEKVTGVDPEEHHEKAEDTVEDHHEETMNEAGRGPNYKESEAQEAHDEVIEHAEKSEKAQAKKDGVVEKAEGHVDKTVDEHVNEDPLGDAIGACGSLQRLGTVPFAKSKGAEAC